MLESRRERLCRGFGRRVMLRRRLKGNRLISCALCVRSLEEEVYPKEQATAQPTQSPTQFNASSRQHHAVQDPRPK